MHISSQISWVKYLARIRSPRSLKTIGKARRRQNKRNDWSYKRKQSLGSLYQKELVNNATAAEIMFGNYLCEMSLTPFEFQRAILTPGFWILDFYLPKAFVAFEIDGPYHKNQTGKDAERDRTLLQDRNIKTYRFTNDQVLHEPNYIKAAVKRALTWQ